MKYSQSRISSRLLKFSSLLALFGLIVGTSNAATIVYNFDDDPNASSANVSGIDAATIDASSFVGPGGGASISTGTDTAFINFSNLANDKAASLTSNNYFTFTLTGVGTNFDLSSFTIDFGGNRGGEETATPNIIVLSNATGSFEELSVTPNSFLLDNDNSNTREFTTGIVDISGSDFDSLSSVTFEIRAFDGGAVSSSGAFRINSVSLGAVAIPEPATFAFALASLSLGFCVFRRR
ncbi:hypothetical protein QEH59_17260 [Coraliomargarita sp. SDUM461004]|uniref:PEP-CTERM protein-sorting domain-containing protein n=1 Tax=Thalassobacterium sedimentorum TaxID=3041258 RepID=A0ABU1AN15_9BACT|nr:hypothetical protein [Coraliomargarita sp. SDUM461004]MDQ8196187.1 hypothetical protein [Coraliomargarita sp. SDUM461004]